MKERKKSIKLNYIYNVVYQLFLIIVPLVTTPYVSRVLTPDGVGKYSFSFSIITYFSIVASLGFNYYAQREIAKYQGDKSKQSKVFWEIVICRLIPTFISLAINLSLCLFHVYQDYNTLMFIFCINIVAIAFDIAFFFQGNEDFGKIVLRNVIIKSISIILIFVFVKNPSHLWIYALINSAMLIVSNASLWGYLPKYLVKVKGIQPFKHFKEVIILFLPTIATSVYVILDKTLIGLLVPGTYTEIVDGVEVIKKYSDLENGYYEQSEKIVKMVMVVITCIGTVMIPRNTHEYAIGNHERVKENLKISSSLVCMLGIPLTLGIVGVSSNMVPWFFGDGYEKCILLMSVLAPLIIIIGFSNVFGVQYLIPTGQNVKFTLGVLAGAVTNLGLNLILIPKLWSLGAAIATVSGELVVTLVMAIMVRKQVSFFRLIINGWKFFISGIVMFIVVYLFGSYLESSIINTLYLVLVGIVVYFIALFLLREKLLLGFIEKIKNKLFSKNDTKLLKRDKTLDLLKIIATFGVVLLHTVNKDIYWLNFILYCFGVLSIPVFFLVDGALLLNKKVSIKYCFKKIISTLIIVQFWATLGFVYCVIKNKSFSNWRIDLFGWFIQMGFSDIFWFLGALIIIYLLLPILKNIFDRKKLCLAFVIILTLICLLINLASMYTSTKYNYVFEGQIIQTFRLYNWLLYFMLGGIIYKNKGVLILKNGFGIALLSGIVAVLYSYYCCKYFMKMNKVEYLYCSPVIIGCSIFIFKYIINLQLYSIYYSIISRATMTVYLLHQTFVLRVFIHLNPDNAFVWCITPLIIFSALIVVGILANKVKYIRRLVAL